MDLDAELLALAGGDSSGEESYSSPPKRHSLSPPPRHSSNPSRDSQQPDMARKGTAKPARRVSRRRSDSDDGAVSASPSQRSDSASMSRSESEAEFKATEDGPMFPHEKLYYDAIDKTRIQNMPEIERERVLAERSEQVERHEQDLTLRRLVAAREKEAAKSAAKNKRKAAAADLEESQRKSSRQRTKLGGGRAGEASSAIEAYKLQRAEKNLRDAQRREQGSSRRAATPEDDYSGADAEAESDNDFDDRRYKRRSPSPPKDEPIADLVDLQRIRVGRDNFAQVCYDPGFEAALANCYARVCLGPGRTPGVNEYRLCQIKGFTSGKPYAMTASNGRPFPVDKYIVAAHGKAEKSWSFLECSMSKFTEDEWRRYRVTMANDDCKLPTRKATQQKLEQINALLNHHFTGAEISLKINAQRQLEAKIYRTNERDDLKEQIREAKQAMNYDLVDELEEKLTAIIPMKLAFNTTLHRPESTYVNKEQEKLAELNRRNKKLNEENVRKAQLAEMRSRRTKKNLAPGVDELFEGGSDVSRAGTPQPPGISRALTPQPNGTPRAGTPGVIPPPRTSIPNPSNLAVPNAAAAALAKAHTSPNGTPRRGGTPVPMILKPVSKDKKGIPQIRKAALDDDILRDMDLGIEIEI